MFAHYLPLLLLLSFLGFVVNMVLKNVKLQWLFMLLFLALIALGARLTLQEGARMLDNEIHVATTLTEK